MNERIRVLSIEAGKYVNTLMIDCLDLSDELYAIKWNQEYNKKFAELIVQECMLQCVKVEDDDELSDYEGGFRDGALLCYQEIKKHFGVEE